MKFVFRFARKSANKALVRLADEFSTFSAHTLSFVRCGATRVVQLGQNFAARAQEEIQEGAQNAKRIYFSLTDKKEANVERFGAGARLEPLLHTSGPEMLLYTFVGDDGLAELRQALPALTQRDWPADWFGAAP